MTRIDPRRHSVRKVLVGAQPIDGAVRGTTLWAPDFWGDSVVPIDTSLARPPSTVVRGMHHPYSVVELPGGLWVAALAGPSTNAPVVLDAIDPTSARIVGRSVPLGEEIGWIAAGFGSIWVQDQGANTLVRYDPVRLRAPGSAPPAQPSRPRVLMPGSLADGEWRSIDPTIPFHVAIRRPGWLSIGSAPRGVELGRFDAPETDVWVIAPTQLFLADGRVEAPPSGALIVRALRANRHLVVRRLPAAAVGGVRATRLLIEAKPFKGYPTFCPDACVPIFGYPNNTTTADVQTIARVSLLPYHRKLLVVWEQTDRVHGSLAMTGELCVRCGPLRARARCAAAGLRHGRRDFGRRELKRVGRRGGGFAEGDCRWRSAEFLGEPDEKSFRPADVAEPIRVFVLDHFAADELRAVLAEPGERLVDVVHGEHDAQVAESVHRRVPVIGDHRRREKARELEPAVAVRRAHHGDLDALVAQSSDAPRPLSFHHGSPFELEAELAKELDRRCEVLDDDADVVHPFESHLRSVYGVSSILTTVMRLAVPSTEVVNG